MAVPDTRGRTHHRQRVALRWDRTRRGYVVQAGPEQSEVRLDGERTVRTFVNGDLVDLPEKISRRRT